MNILYDYQIFEMQDFGGISKSFCELISNLPPSCSYEIGIKESNNIHLHQSHIINNLHYNTLDKNNFITKNYFPNKIRLYNICNKIFPFIPTTHNKNLNYSIKLLKEKQYDIFHPTFFNDYFIQFLGNKPFVLTIHDMIPEIYPNYCKKDLQAIQKRKLANKASAIIAVSNQTKNDIIRFLNIPDKKITVIHHGWPQINTIKESTSRIIDVPYFLYVGTRNTYKNFPLLIKEFSKVIKYKQNIKLVCTGPSFSNDELCLFKQYNITNNIINLKVNDQELGILYSQALAFIFPSLYEGFGMPILEAYAYHCPVILNNSSCFPEIAGEAAIYFSMEEDKSDLFEKMMQIINYTTEERNTLIQKEINQLSLYSWKKSAEKLFKVYASI